MPLIKHLKNLEKCVLNAEIAIFWHFEEKSGCVSYSKAYFIRKITLLWQMMASQKGEYTKDEVKALESVYDRGLRSKIKQKDLLDEAKASTGLESERIMVGDSDIYVNLPIIHT